ncbi:hypothetical protein [Natrialba swarupiae]|uniref:Zinc ribbon domain-containing protein n=1 Tax=Natrialba swarupiae TaxID=2448032 RepID=A0A5D5ASV1_9EURY|nr:hypothetical protein [Natrialba swarupiae]TYT63955.1 hypothetical protein FYC77_01755 [Natrialba swarupiae]
MTAEYPSATREIGMVILAIVALVVVYLMVTVTLAFGLFGAFVLVAFVYVWFFVWNADSGDLSGGQNCPSCGSRIGADEDVCEYCGESL